MSTVDNPYDVERFRRVAALIKENEDRFNMDVWARMVTDTDTNECQTSMCFAGFTVHEAGYRLDYTESVEVPGIFDATFAKKDGLTSYIPKAAAELLAPVLASYESTRRMPQDVLDIWFNIDSIFMSDAKTMDELWDNIEKYTDGMVTRG